MKATTIVVFQTDGEPGEARAIEMLCRWHGPAELNEREPKRGRLAHPGGRALNSLREGSEITSHAVRHLVDYLRILDDWAHAEIELFTALAESERCPEGEQAMARAIIKARHECLDDIVEFGQVIVTPMLTAISALADAKVTAGI